MCTDFSILSEVFMMPAWRFEPFLSSLRNSRWDRVRAEWPEWIAELSWNSSRNLCQLSIKIERKCYLTLHRYKKWFKACFKAAKMSQIYRFFLHAKPYNENQGYLWEQIMRANLCSRSSDFGCAPSHILGKLLCSTVIRALSLMLWTHE